MDLQTLWKAALVQLLAVGVLFAALALALPREFFVDWGWITGPAAWMLCAALTARVLSLPLIPALTGAVLAGPRRYDGADAADDHGDGQGAVWVTRWQDGKMTR